MLRRLIGNKRDESTRAIHNYAYDYIYAIIIKLMLHFSFFCVFRLMTHKHRRGRHTHDIIDDKITS